MTVDDILDLWRNWQESANLSQRTIDERAGGCVTFHMPKDCG
jgi:hypothetical protein